MIISREEYLELRALKNEYQDNKVIHTGIYYYYPCYRNERDIWTLFDDKYFIHIGQSSSGHHVKLNLPVVTKAIEEYEQSYQEVYKKFL